MVSAMQHCHARSVFHRDLKPENILLGGASLDEIKIADFGLAALLSQVDHGDGGHFLNHTKCGSIMYAAPELLLSNERVGYDPATADIWSLGVILYSMLAGALPFKVAPNPSPNPHPHPNPHPNPNPHPHPHPTLTLTPTLALTSPLQPPCLCPPLRLVEQRPRPHLRAPESPNPNPNP